MYVSLQCIIDLLN